MQWGYRELCTPDCLGCFHLFDPGTTVTNYYSSFIHQSLFALQVFSTSNKSRVELHNCILGNVYDWLAKLAYTIQITLHPLQMTN